MILPPYMRCSPKLAEVAPVLYLRGLSISDFQPALAAGLGGACRPGCQRPTSRG